MLAFTIIVKIAVFLVAAGFCLTTLKKIPRDISAIVEAIRERDRGEITASVCVALFYWGLSVALIWLVVYPGIMSVVYGWKTFVKLLTGFR